MIHCPSCNRQATGDERFCRWCGAALPHAWGGGAPAHWGGPAAGGGGPAAPVAQSWPGHGPGTAAPAAGFMLPPSLRHPKESAYFALAALAAGVAWLFLIWIVLLVGWLLIIPLAIIWWLAEQFFRAQLLGNAVKVSEAQFPEIHTMVTDYCRRLGLSRAPEVYIVNSDGLVNALAVRRLRGKYILLMSGLVDLLLSTGSLDELGSVLGHELGHHAMGHTSPWRGLFLAPGLVVPFLGAAYSRACELTADRVGMWLAGSKDAAIRGLAALACGSRALAPSLNLASFLAQEREVEGFFAFLNDLFSTHPRITKRVEELQAGEAEVLAMRRA